MIQNIECVYNICMCVLAGTDRCLLITSSSTCWDGVKNCDINLLAWNSCEPWISNLQTSFRFRLRGVKSTATQWYREAALSTASSLTLQIQQTFRWMQNCRMLCYGTEFPRLVNLMLLEEWLQGCRRMPRICFPKLRQCWMLQHWIQVGRLHSQ